MLKDEVRYAISNGITLIPLFNTNTTIINAIKKNPRYEIKTLRFVLPKNFSGFPKMKSLSAKSLNKKLYLVTNECFNSSNDSKNRIGRRNMTMYEAYRNWLFFIHEK